MGSNTSKPSETAVQIHQKDEYVEENNSDPRSPTPEVTRTPLQGKTGSKHNITKNVDLSKTFECTKGEEKLIHNNPILSAVIRNHLQSFDPRSPSQDFERTPIVLSSSDELPTNRIGNYGSPSLPNDVNVSLSSNDEVEGMTPKNLCNGFFDLTLNDTDEPLGSSTASNEAAIDNNISKQEENPTQFLETNFEYVKETETQSIDNQEVITNNIIVDKMEPPTSIQKFKILDNDPRSPSVGIDRTPIVVSKVLDDSCEGNVEEMSDDTLIKVLQTTNAELRQSSGKQDLINDEGLLIYEDESAVINDTPKKSKSASNSGSRTPLSCMKNKADAAHARSKSANLFYDSHNHLGVQGKVNKKTSHIPRLKSLSKAIKNPAANLPLMSISKVTAVIGECENTPPHSHRDMWGTDSSIVL